MKYFVILFFILISSNTFALINGAVIKKNFPVVRLNFKNNSHICTGTYIDHYTILTAGHCVSKKKTWKGFSVEVDSVMNYKGQKVEVIWAKSIPHPNFEYHWYGNSHDVGIIKTSYFKFNGNFPNLASSDDKVGRNAILYGCGRIDLSNKKRKCLQGENDYSGYLDHLVVWGESVNKRKKGFDVSVAPNDSGGPLVDKTTNRIIGVQWGTLVPLLYKVKLKAPSFITSFFNVENLRFILKNMGEKMKSTGSVPLEVFSKESGYHANIEMLVDGHLTKVLFDTGAPSSRVRNDKFISKYPVVDKKESKGVSGKGHTFDIIQPTHDKD